MEMWRPGDFGLYQGRLYKVLDNQKHCNPEYIRVGPMPTIPLKNVITIHRSQLLPLNKEQQLVYKICGDLPKNRRTKTPLPK